MASGARPFLVDRWVPRGLSQRVLATRGQTDIRGLVTAGRAVRLEAITRIAIDLKRRGTDSVIVGCTELSPATALLESADLKVFDSNSCLARAALRSKPSA